METIYDYIKTQRTWYRSQVIEIADGYEYSQYQTLRTIELYHNSKFETGNRDSLKREKPFYNITKFRVNVAVRATDTRWCHQRCLLAQKRLSELMGPC
jgi:hypothetical protein